jgi:hypothetical protein
VAVGEVPDREALVQNPKVRVFQGKGRTLMPGLGDAHTHFTWNGGDLARLGELAVEEHVLLTARSAQCYIDSGYTMFVAPLPSYMCHELTAQVLWRCLGQGTTRCCHP